MVRGDFNILITDFDIRWTREFESRTVVSHGRTVARFDECMKFLIYTCDTPTCGAWGMCNQWCFYCKTSAKSTSTAKILSNSANYGAAYKAYFASLGTNKATASKALFLTTPGGAPFAPGATKSAPPTTPSAKAFANVTEAYSYYEQHQELVVAHASRYRTSN